MYFPGPDDVAHFKGAGSSQYRRSLRSLDKSLGGILCALDNGGVLDRMTLVLTADHGMHDVIESNYVDLANLLCTSAGIRAYSDDQDIDEDQAYLEGENQWHYRCRFQRFRHWCAVVTHSGERQAFLHLRVGTDWSVRPRLEQIMRFHQGGEPAPVAAEGQPSLPELIVADPAIGLVAARDGDDAVQIWGKSGVARIERQRSPKASAYAYAYRLLSGDDPLFQDDGGAPPLADGAFHASREWLEATAASRHPDAVAQLGDLFDSRRTGDVAIFAAAGWDFSPKYVGGHGGLEPDEMHIPMYFAGPAIGPGKRVPAARLVDLVPTVLDLMGVGERAAWYRFDGVSLAPQIIADAAATRPSE